MNLFEWDRKQKLNHSLGFRFINKLGMVAWHEDAHYCAIQKLRMLHPFSWLWLLALVTTAVVMYGVVEVVKEIKRLPEDMVWW